MVGRWTDGELLRAEEARRILNISKAAVYKLAAEGTLPSVRVGRSVRIVRAELERYLDGRLMDRTTFTTAPQATDPDTLLRRIEEQG